MSLIQRSFPLVQQPTVPEINWSDPITDGLIGLIWCDTGRDLVSQPYPLNSLGMTRVLTPSGVGANKTVTSYGYYTPRNNYGQWKVASTPITLAVFTDYITPAGTSILAGVSGTPGGYYVGVRYGVRYNLAGILVGGVTRSVEEADASTGPTVYAMSATDTQLIGYDNGKPYGSLTYSGTSTISYDNTYNSMVCGGSVDNPGATGTYYWSALWTRVLSPDEHLRLAKDPWCLFNGSSVTVPLADFTVSYYPILSGTSAYNITSTTFSILTNITYP